MKRKIRFAIISILGLILLFKISDIYFTFVGNTLQTNIIFGIFAFLYGRVIYMLFY